jgi:polysaccharide biosynthesis PFTS motif protein
MERSKPVKVIKIIVLTSIYIVLGILRAITRTEKRPTVLIFSLTREQIFDANSMQAFINFLAEDRLNIKYSPDQVLIELRDVKTFFKKRDNLVTFDIATTLLLRNSSNLEFLSVFKSAINACWKSNTTNDFSLSWISELKKELFDKPFWEQYFADLKDSTTLITTNSSFSKPPTPFLLVKGNERSLRRVMFWYSANIKPIETSSMNFAQETKFMNLNSFIDEHLAWTLDQKKFLEAKGLHNVKAVGSIIFRPKISKNNQLKDIDIAYFDVTPIESPNTYYTYTNCANVLMDIIEARNKLQLSLNRSIEIYLKPKRNYTKFHSKSYIELLAGLAKSGEIKILSTAEDLYRTISKSNYVVGIPFTSPVLIAQEMGIPCAFYAGSSHNLEIRSTENGIPVLNSIEDLTKELQKSIS